ncbi:MAG: hypothetical protein AAF762_00395 [Pseudomonadota bacterium]
MDDETVKKAGTGDARAVLELAEGAMTDLVKIWNEFLVKSRNGEFPKNSDFTTASNEMVRLRGHLLDGIKKHERDVLHEANRIDTAPIDFDARRNEIGSRLARLRDVRDDG